MPMDPPSTHRARLVLCLSLLQCPAPASTSQATCVLCWAVLGPWQVVDVNRERGLPLPDAAAVGVPHQLLQHAAASHPQGQLHPPWRLAATGHRLRLAAEIHPSMQNTNNWYFDLGLSGQREGSNRNPLPA